MKWTECKIKKTHGGAGNTSWEFVRSCCHVPPAASGIGGFYVLPSWTLAQEGSHQIHRKLLPPLLPMCRSTSFEGSLWEKHGRKMASSPPERKEKTTHSECLHFHGTPFAKTWETKTESQKASLQPKALKVSPWLWERPVLRSCYITTWYLTTYNCYFFSPPKNRTGFCPTIFL